MANRNGAAMNTTNVVISLVILALIAVGGAYYAGYLGGDPAAVEETES